MEQVVSIDEMLVSHPVVVITVPVFNEGKYIKDTLDSIANQVWRDFKVLISDNASTDETKKICKDFCRKDDRFHYVYHPQNLGAVPNFQYLLDHTESTYFMWIGGHDLIHPDFLTTHLFKMNNDNNIFLSYSSTQWIDQDGNFIRISDGGRLADIKGKSWVRYINSTACLGEYTCINQLIRRTALDGLVIEKVYACDQIILSRIIYLGLSHREPKPLYLAREFSKVRPLTEMERVTGKTQAKINFNSYKDAYFRECNKLFRTNNLLKYLLGILLFLSLERRIIAHIFKYRIIYKINKITKSLFPTSVN